MRVQGSYCVLFFLLLELPLAAWLLPNSIAGFSVLLVNGFLMGISNAIVKSSIFGLASRFPYKCIIATSVGAGIAAILINLLRMSCMLLFGVDR